MIITVVMVISMTVATMGWTLTATVPAVVDIGLATGLTGAPGTLTVLECHTLRRSKYNRQICNGNFVYDATGEEVAVGAFSWAAPGRVYPAQITSGRDRAGFRGVKGALAALLLPSIGLFFMIMLGIALRLRFLNLFNGAVISAVGLVGIVIGLVARWF